MKRALILPLVLLASACGITPAEHAAKGQAAFAAHDYRAAKIHFAAALDANPQDKKLLLLQARTQVALGDGEGADATLQRLNGSGAPSGELAELTAEAALLRKAPQVALSTLGTDASAEAERLRALALIQQGKVAEAGDHFAKGAAAGGSARLFADYARYKLLGGDADGARALAEKAARTDPKALDPLLVQGQLAVRSGDLKTALERYDRAAKLYPASLAAVTGEAAVLGDLGRLDEMDKLTSQAAAFAPKDPTLLYLRARSAVARKDWSGARTLVEANEADIDRQSPIRLLYGEALLRSGQNEQAIAQLEPIVTAQPGNRLAVRLLAESELAAGSADRAMATLRPLAQSDLARPDELALMARASKAAGAPDAAQWAAKAASPSPRNLLADIARADAAIKRSDWSSAIALYQGVLARTDGKNVLVLNNLAYSEAMVGNYDKALQLASRALAIQPNNPSVLDTAGYIRLKAGRDRGEALRLLRLAAAKAPQNASIRAHLAEAEKG